MTNKFTTFAEDEFDYNNESSSTIKQTNQQPNICHSQPCRKRRKPLFTEKIAVQKQLDIQKEIKQERKKRPKNLLFTTGYSSEESLSGCDTDNDAK